MEDMPRSRKPYVHREPNRHGKVCWYFRVGKGPRTRLPGAYESPEWLAKYAELMAKASVELGSPPKDNTFGWLVDRYLESAAFKVLSPSTQSQRRNILKSVRKTAEKVVLGMIDRRMIAEGRDRRADKPHAAINFMKIMGYLFEWAIDAGYMNENPARGIKRPKVKSEGFKTWTEDDIAKFYSKHPEGSQARLAMDMILATGLRRGDVWRIGPQHIKDGVLEWRASKNAETVYIPLHPEFAAKLAQIRPVNMVYFVTPKRGAPFKSKESFGNWFGDVCAEAGVDGRAHGLRKTRAVALAESGNSNSELKALLGWRTDAMANLYTRKADRKRLALSGAAKLNGNILYPHLVAREDSE